jgi:hypothetical protein
LGEEPLQARRLSLLDRGPSERERPGLGSDRDSLHGCELGIVFPRFSALAQVVPTRRSQLLEVCSFLVQ